MDAIHELLQSLGNHLWVAFAIGIAVWAPIAWFLILALFRPKARRVHLSIRIILFICGFVLSNIVYGMVVVTTWFNMDEWAYFRAHPDSLWYGGSICHLPPMWVQVMPFALLPVLFVLFSKFKNLLRAA
jgi:hypothetical protein